GMGVTDVSKLLKDNGVIEQSSTFVLYSKIRNKEGKIMEGDYILNSNMSYDQIILAMKSGNTVKEEIKITFFEGMSAFDIATLLEEKKVCDRDEFLLAVNTQSYDYEFENMLPKNELRFRKLEGYLFPDTYDFYVGENVYSVLKKFVKNFQSKVFPQLYDEIKNSGMTLDEAVTLASVIQEEASNEKEMYKVSSVFHNRMDNISAGLPMLQSDVTKLYIENDVKPFQTKKNQKMYDAYNTYVCEGLPVGPICSPGIHAIKAAIKPDETSYYYFVTDANGKYYYSKTFDEHMSNVRKAGAVKKAS
ncbi:MAG: endolytic transglycosylase MltG, partial [Oscillospiraceae bacterium]